VVVKVAENAVYGMRAGILNGEDPVMPPRGPERPSVRIEADLRRRLAAGEFGDPGSQLPSVADLAAQYGVARGTIARVLKKLEADSLVTVVAGWGSFVA